MIKKLLNWFLRIYSRKKLYKIKFVHDIPEQMRQSILYVVTNEGFDWQAVMICPCGCNKVLQMNLIADYSPSWKYKVDQKLVSLYPSVHRQVGCRSHFYLTKGKISWC
ncbi:MAG: hypothetical protein JWQ09_3615 [Segetibacter sp.]|nr:hypothetical protein [Segetibacter sp.]